MGRRAGWIREDDVLTNEERAVVRYATAMSEDAAIADELFAELRRFLSEAQIVELTSAIAWENARARFNRALGIGSQGCCELDGSSRVL